MKVLPMIAAGLALTLAGEAAAQSTPRADARQANQLHRIYNGVENGSLTPKESGSLLRGQAHVERKKRRFKSDGVVTRSERYRLNRSQNRQSRRIYRRKHN